MTSTVTTTTVITNNHNHHKSSDIPIRLPSIDEFRRAVPPECFVKSLPISLIYLIWDYAILIALYYSVHWIESTLGIVGLLAWYALMGMFGSALFIVGHDCGHGTFSDYQWVNDVFGHVAHAPLIAPFWPWQKSHRQHHTFTSHLHKDRGHPWVTLNDYEERSWIARHFSKLPISALFRWNPIYTIAGLPDGSHFWPFSKMFTNRRERIQCVISATLCLICAMVAFNLCDYSIYNFIKYYYIPIMCQGYWLVMITYLQHQDEDIEVFEDDRWSYVRGQMQTIDRPYGFGIDNALHHITDGHVAHHLFFTQIPHYHLIRATKAIRQLIEPMGIYRRCNSYDFLWQFCRLNIQLEYLIGEGTGLLKYAKKGDKQK